MTESKHLSVGTAFANDEKLETPNGESRANRLRGLLLPTRVGNPRRASALRITVDSLA